MLFCLRLHQTGLKFIQDGNLEPLYRLLPERVPTATTFESGKNVFNQLNVTSIPRLVTVEMDTKLTPSCGTYSRSWITAVFGYLN
jgi:hypothetical protein